MVTRRKYKPKAAPAPAAYAEGGAPGDDYNTPVPDETAFQAWKAKNAPNDSGADYDLRGAYLADMQRDPDNGHMGDQFKKPNHPTFSDQSQYAVGDQRDRAGHWVGPEGPDQTFVPPAPYASGGATGGDAVSPLQRAAAAQQHAEHLQAQHHHRQRAGLQEPQRSPEELEAIHRYVESIPNLSLHQRRFLESHPTLMTEPFVQLMQHAIMIARAAGIAEDTPQFDAAIIDGVMHDVQRHHHLKQLTSASAAPTLQNAQTPQNDAALHQDVDQHVADLQAEVAQHMAAHQPAPSAPLPPKRRSMPMSAPVSRDYPSTSGRPHESNTLSPAEREIARNSFGDPNMSNQERELLYLRNRNKYRQAKADGSYSSQGNG